MSSIESALTISVLLMGLGTLAWYLGRIQTEVRWARRREAEAGRTARLRIEKQIAEGQSMVADQAARRQALDEFLSELHAEEHAYLRQRSTGAGQKRSVVVEERLYFRNLPISNWTEQELTFYTSTAPPDRAKSLPRGVA
jgi:hypothetical protein